MAPAVEGTELEEQKPPPSHERPKSEFNPCNNAKITSPFYLYNHDSPRPSFDVTKSNKPVQVAIHDLESGSFDNLSPSVTQEKKDAQNGTKSKFRFWHREKQCMTKPRQRGCLWFSRLTTRQKIMVKIGIALLIVGAAVAIAVGISVKVHGGVYKDSNTTTEIG